MTLELQGVSRSVEGRVHIHPTDLVLQGGTMNVLLGPTLAGKTSLMRILAGLSAPADGQVLWNGQPLAAGGGSARRALLYIGHTNALKDDLTLLEALAFLGQLPGLDEPARHAEARNLAESPIPC